MLGRKDSRQGHHHELNVGDGHARPFRFFLRVLHHYDVLGDSIHLHVMLMHIRAKQDHVHGMEPPAVGVKEGHDFKRCHL
jgi:hypothetical protein